MNVLIVEDEPIIARRIKRMISNELRGKLTDLAVRHALSEGLEYLKDHEIDLLFLDLNLNGEDGFVLLKSLVASSFHTIIISAYKEKAIEAFEYGVLDFVPKPFSQSRLVQALSRFMSQDIEGKGSQAKYLAVQKRGRLILLEIRQLAYVQGAGIYSELVFQDGRKEIHNKSLEKLSQLLPSYFDRIHKSYIINTQLIQELSAQAGGKYSVLLKEGSLLPVSRTRYKALKEKWAI
ncbi:MAG: LytTR family DNA-binding domain-containing protein [Bacteroidota bacterium]